MGSVFGDGPDEPDLPPPPKEPDVPKRVGEQITQRRTVSRRRAALAGGRAGTILTSPLGLPSRSKGKKKTLLGG